MSFSKNKEAEIQALFDILRDKVKEKFDVEVESLDDIKVSSRKKPLVYFRKMMMIILGETYCSMPHNYNQEEIAKVVGRDRTSLIHHSKIHLNEYSRYNDYKEEYDEIRAKWEMSIGMDEE